MSDKPTHRKAADCETCKWWVNEQDGRPAGVCCRYPPTPVVGPYEYETRWPETFIHDWCGEWSVGSERGKEAPWNDSQAMVRGM